VNARLPIAMKLSLQGFHQKAASFFVLRSSFNQAQSTKNQEPVFFNQGHCLNLCFTAIQQRTKYQARRTCDLQLPTAPKRRAIHKRQ